MENFDLDHPDSAASLRPFRPPLSTMAPTIVLHDGKPLLVLGSGGSGWIPSIVVGTIVNVIDRAMSLCEAVTSPRVVWSADSTQKVHVEVAAPITEVAVDALAAHGFPAVQRLFFPAAPMDLTYFGDANAVFIDPQDGTLVGVGDPRRDGVALGATRLLGTRDSPVTSLPCWRELAGSP